LDSMWRRVPDRPDPAGRPANPAIIREARVQVNAGNPEHKLNRKYH
jgi:hypothetical protein